MIFKPKPSIGAVLDIDLRFSRILDWNSTGRNFKTTKPISKFRPALKSWGPNSSISDVFWCLIPATDSRGLQRNKLDYHPLKKHIIPGQWSFKWIDLSRQASDWVKVFFRRKVCPCSFIKKYGAFVVPPETHEIRYSPKTSRIFPGTLLHLPGDGDVLIHSVAEEDRTLASLARVVFEKMKAQPSKLTKIR